MILHGHVHCPENAVRHIGRTRHKQKVTTWPPGSSHGIPLLGKCCLPGTQADPDHTTFVWW
ncbi:hypothetical protein GL4_3379 [Methyloceanibacter caenitepidi]|uniref:Uncharacterized protein n=1 Tax=Methyloceanibacter caenitepidi TaxID=1384459 RepID=A0A0A8K8E8_9HYPH|nr:hypothetical protein GL4_3379 [Methyloceanibacter caenitepidi]